MSAPPTPQVYIVEDDQSVRNSLIRLMRSADPKAFAFAEQHREPTVT